MPKYTLTLPSLPEKFVSIDSDHKLHQWLLTALRQFEKLEKTHLIEYSTDNEQERLVKINKDLQADHQTLSQYLQKPITLDAQTAIKDTWEGFSLNLQRLGPIETISTYIATHRINDCDKMATRRRQRKLPKRPDEMQKKDRSRWSQQIRIRLSLLFPIGRKRWSQTNRASGIYNEDTKKKEPISSTPGAS